MGCIFQETSLTSIVVVGGGSEEEEEGRSFQRGPAVIAGEGEGEREVSE